MAINITPQGVVEYSEMRDGERWRTTIEPGDTVRAAELLDTEEMAQVEAAWTPEIVEAWQEAREADQAQPEPGLPNLATGNVGFGTQQFGSGQGVIAIAEAVVPPSTNPVGGGILFSLEGALYWRGSDGTVTQVAPK